MAIGLCHATVYAQVKQMCNWETQHQEELVLFVSCHLSSDAG